MKNFKSKTRRPRTPRPSHRLTVLRQVCNLIPEHWVPRLARGHGVASRGFGPWSHVVSLIYGQLTHALGLNDICDGLRVHSGPLSAIRGARPPCRNTFSHANRERPAAMAEELFWQCLKHFQNLHPGFGQGRQGRGVTRRFRRVIHVVDSTTLALVASCMDWARHRRRKAAAKCHMRLDLQSFLPRFAIVDTAGQGDNRRARELCAGVRSGEIVIFDKAYVDFAHLHDLDQREVYWVTRSKDNLKLKVRRRLPLARGPGPILRDDLVVVANARSRRLYPGLMRRVVARVEVDGRMQRMTFLTNHLSWSPASVADLYRSRWSIEVFFKQIKQTLQLSDFVGHNANAVRWQVWIALLVYLLLRVLAFVSGWTHSFTRLFTLVRSALWNKLALWSFLERYGTADGHFRLLACPDQAYLPGWNPGLWDSTSPALEQGG